MTVSLLKALAVVSLGFLLAGSGPVHQMFRTPQEEVTNKVGIRVLRSQDLSRDNLMDYCCRDPATGIWEKGLKWKKRYYGPNEGGRDEPDINRIPEADIPKEHVGCGMDDSNRAFMAIRYVCTKVHDGITRVARGVLTIYERRVGNSDYLGSGGFDAEGCSGFANYLHPEGDDFLTNIRRLLIGKPLSVSHLDENTGRDERYTVQLCDRKICPQPGAGLSWTQWARQLFG